MTIIIVLAGFVLLFWTVVALTPHFTPRSPPQLPVQLEHGRRYFLRIEGMPGLQVLYWDDDRGGEWVPTTDAGWFGHQPVVHEVIGPVGVQPLGFRLFAQEGGAK